MILQARLLRTRRVRLAAGLWIVVGIAAAVRMRQIGSGAGADQVLRGVFAVVVLPLLAYAIVSAALGNMGLRPSLRGAIALGADPTRAATSTIGGAALVSGVACALLGSVLCVIAHGRSDAPLAFDLATTSGTAFLGGALYAAYFCAGSAFGKGALRGVFLVIDWVLGMPAGFGSLFTPRAHVTSLLGGAAAFDLPRRVSFGFVIVLFVVYAGMALLLVRRGRR